MEESRKVLKCVLCSKTIEILSPGSDEVVCCGMPMRCQMDSRASSVKTEIIDYTAQICSHEEYVETEALF
ncbi:MAG: hypothetical protein JXD22_04390 [Sedimentisphaerales bacterium]|nr:hypothetical protein [Sedimentisphaerales bacterium]